MKAKWRNEEEKWRENDNSEENKWKKGVSNINQWNNVESYQRMVMKAENINVSVSIVSVKAAVIVKISNQC